MKKYIVTYWDANDLDMNNVDTIIVEAVDADEAEKYLSPILAEHTGNDELAERVESDGSYFILNCADYTYTTEGRG